MEQDVVLNFTDLEKIVDSFLTKTQPLEFTCTEEISGESQDVFSYLSMRFGRYVSFQLIRSQFRSAPLVAAIGLQKLGGQHQR